MNRLFVFCAVGVAGLLPIHAQDLDLTVTSHHDASFFEFMLTRLVAFEAGTEGYVRQQKVFSDQFGLDSSDWVVISNAAESLRLTLNQLEQSAIALRAGRSSYSEADGSALLQLSKDREDAIASLARLIVRSVRPDTAQRLKTPGRVALQAEQKINREVR